MIRVFTEAAISHGIFGSFPSAFFFFDLFLGQSTFHTCSTGQQNLQKLKPQKNRPTLSFFFFNFSSVRGC